MEEILLYSSLVQEKKINSFIFLIEIELNAIKQRERETTNCSVKNVIIKFHLKLNETKMLKTFIFN